MGEYLYTLITHNFKTRSGLSINCGYAESVTLGIASEKKFNTLVNTQYRPPNGYCKLFQKFLTASFLNTKNCKDKAFILQEILILTYVTMLSINLINLMCQNLIYQNSFIRELN